MTTLPKIATVYGDYEVSDEVNGNVGLKGWMVELCDRVNDNVDLPLCGAEKTLDEALAIAAEKHDGYHVQADSDAIKYQADADAVFTAFFGRVPE